MSQAVSVRSVSENERYRQQARAKARNADKRAKTAWLIRFAILLACLVIVLLEIVEPDLLAVGLGAIAFPFE